MALVLTVGGPRDVFVEPYASNLVQALRAHFGDDMDLDGGESWSSDELPWSGWAELQARAAEKLEPAMIRHLLSIGAWKGVFLPVDTDPGDLDGVPGDTTPLAIASLTNLIHELERVGKALSLPTDEAGIDSLIAALADDDSSEDENFNVQVFASLLRCARIASQAKRPLWVVK